MKLLFLLFVYVFFLLHFIFIRRVIVWMEESSFHPSLMRSPIIKWYCARPYTVEINWIYSMLTLFSLSFAVTICICIIQPSRSQTFRSNRPSYIPLDRNGGNARCKHSSQSQLKHEIIHYFVFLFPLRFCGTIQFEWQKEGGGSFATSVRQRLSRASANIHCRRRRHRCGWKCCDRCATCGRRIDEIPLRWRCVSTAECASKTSKWRRPGSFALTISIFTHLRNTWRIEHRRQFSREYNARRKRWSTPSGRHAFDFIVDVIASNGHNKAAVAFGCHQRTTRWGSCNLVVDATKCSRCHIDAHKERTRPEYDQNDWTVDQTGWQQWQSPQQQCQSSQQ